MNRENPSRQPVLSALSIFGRLLVVTVLLTACAANGQQPEQVVIAPLGSGETVGSRMTREELEDHVRRFADRYFTRIALATAVVRDETSSVKLKRLMHDWKTVSHAAVVEVAIGPNAVTNLLDMMVLTRLSRLVVESHWVPNYLGEEFGPDFLQTFVDLEEDIWTVADDVLTTQHQEELRYLVDQWHEENPEQYFPWYIRLSNFSGQRAASLAAVQQSGGLLKEVARAREAAEEIQAFGERVLFYMQRAPALTTNEFESSASTILGGPEIGRLVEDLDRFVMALERFVQVVDDLPDDRLHAIDQFMDRVGDERQELLQDLATAEPGLRAVLADLLPVLESLEKAVVTAKTPNPNPNARPFNITEYTALVAQASVTAGELRLLIQSVSDLLGNASAASPLVAAIVEAEGVIADRLFLQLVALIVIFFVLLLVYRLVANRLFRGQ
jgi:hypothetical protein